MEVFVAVVGDPTVPLGRGFNFGPGGDIEAPYEQLPKVTLKVQESETLSQVLTRACEHIGVELPWEGPVIRGIGFIDFYREDRAPLLATEITIVDGEGRVKWVRWKDVPYRELMRAEEAGVLVGDPRRPYLFLQPEIGNGVLVPLVALYGLWRLFWGIVDDLERVQRLANAARRLLRGRAREAGEVVQAHYKEWQRNGARPDNLRVFLGERAWSLDHLAEVLGCTPREAEALLLGFGHERGDDGLWRPGGSEEARFLRETLNVLIRGGVWTDEDLKRILSRRTEQYLESGRAPDVNWEELRDVRGDPDKLKEINEQLRAIHEQQSWEAEDS